MIQLKLLGDWSKASRITDGMAARFDRAQEQGEAIAAIDAAAGPDL